MYNPKFDVAVGNPPYQNGDNSDFYKQFIIKSQTLSDTVAFIVPATHFRTLKSFKDIQQYKYLESPFKGVNILASWFVWKKNSGNSVRIYGKDGSYLQETDIPIITPRSDIEAYRFIKGIVSRELPGYEVLSGSLHRRESLPDPKGIKCIWGAGRREGDFDWITVSNSLKDKIGGLGDHKVVFSGDTNTTTIGAMKYADPTYGCANKAHYIKVESAQEAVSLIKYLDSKFVRALVPNLKGMTTKNSRSVFRRIPSIDITREWTDQEIYAHFNLNEAEILYIENTVKL